MTHELCSVDAVCWGKKNKSFSHRQKPWRKCHLTLSQFILLSDAVNRTQPDMLCAWVGASDEKGAAVFCFVWLRFGLLSEWTSNTYKHRQTCGLWSPGYFASSGSPRKCWSSFVKSNILIRMKVYWSQAHKKSWLCTRQNYTFDLVDCRSVAWDCQMIQQKTCVLVSCYSLHEFNMTELGAEQQDCLLPVKKSCVRSKGMDDLERSWEWQEQL